MDLFDYVIDGNIKEIAEYLKKGDINIQDERGQSLLHYAVRYSQFEVVNYLVGMKININSIDKYGETPLFSAINTGSMIHIEYLIKNNASLYVRNIKNETIMARAVINGNTKIIKYLIDIGYEYQNENLIYHAIRSSKMDIYSFFIKDSDYKKIDLMGNTLLHHAAKTNNLEIIEDIIDKVAINHLNKNHETALFNAVRFASIDVVRYLISMGAIITLKNNIEQTITDIALDYASSDIYSYILGLEDDIIYQKYKYDYPLHDAVRKGDAYLLRALLNQKKYIIKKDIYGYYPLDYALELNNNEMINLLKQ